MKAHHRKAFLFLNNLTASKTSQLVLVVKTLHKTEINHKKMIGAAQQETISPESETNTYMTKRRTFRTAP